MVFSAISAYVVSVPIKGLFNLTGFEAVTHPCTPEFMLQVSVPIKGLFNLTLSLKQQILTGSKMQKTAEITN